MKSIDALRALQNLPSSETWLVLYFDCYPDADEFCKACFGKEAILVQMKTLAGHNVLATSTPLKMWADEAPIYDAVVIDPDGIKLHDYYIYMLED